MVLRLNREKDLFNALTIEWLDRVEEYANKAVEQAIGCPILCCATSVKAYALDVTAFTIWFEQTNGGTTKSGRVTPRLETPGSPTGPGR